MKKYVNIYFEQKKDVPCPLKLHRDALGSTIDKAFENQINDLEESFESLPPKTDVWQTMSSMVFDRELSNLLSTVINDPPNVLLLKLWFELSLLRLEDGIYSVNICMLSEKGQRLHGNFC